ncbi:MULTISPECIES: ABC transporter substrate-binding protein [unclassified Campylobacter]|uniref:ABC transporter substrate-binding protein n=1 Tax=unclassified Campylobacter TaxID=2593542 RepID=UPI001237B531|nr:MULTISPECIES: ABC transporter substrate-binding protein [unclassified Campylobacter]KAA6225392.1 ABC transporter substrate-binding protein [Campylobacter sp. LR185c]KAA6227088.1 ABC transporter substrate-binding protein [Campylobacter sp. LR196d]KAA6228714.1 ABC transporter substrate-binding protein [Campylobacter sp. LR286c]KAA6229524.1 ABC transporter substrate-binding protein [Campylobacter sp. LR264d]KAA6230768.1 ABC transporter substrate-binding protein [Campylobacter sp. LR291e]
MKKICLILGIFAFINLQAKEHKIGIVLPLTGAVAAYGQDILSGVSLANKLSFKLENNDEVKLVIIDTKGDKLETANGVNRLISQDKVIALIGEAITPNTIQAISIADNKQIPIIAPVASGDKLLDKRTFASRVCFNDSFQGDKFASYVSKELNLKKVAIIIDQSNVYSLGLAKAFEASFIKNGGQISKKININSGDKDFRAIISQLKNIDIDFVYMPIYHPEAALFARQARQMNFIKLLSAADGVNNQAFIELGGEAVNGVIFTDSFDYNNLSTKLGKDFLNEYEKTKGSRELPAFSAMGADAYFVMVNAMNACINDLSSKCINEKIKSTKNYESVGGILTINLDGNAVRPVVIKEIVNQKQHFKSSINP